MTPTLRTHDSAATELAAAVAWYEEQQPGLGADFLDGIGRTIEQVRHYPRIGPSASADERTRRLRVARFPYDVVYRVTPDEIVIVAVAHLKRRPGYWKNRVTP